MKNTGVIKDESMGNTNRKIMHIVERPQSGTTICNSLHSISSRNFLHSALRPYLNVDYAPSREVTITWDITMLQI